MPIEIQSPLFKNIRSCTKIEEIMNILNFKELIFLTDTGQLNEQSLLLSSIWFEFSDWQELYKSEYTNLEQQDVIVNKQRELAKQSNSHLLYAIPDKIPKAITCDCYIKARIYGDREDYTGYISIIDLKVVSVDLFLPNQDSIFYCSELPTKDEIGDSACLKNINKTSKINYDVDDIYKSLFDFKGVFYLTQ